MRCDKPGGILPFREGRWLSSPAYEMRPHMRFHTETVTCTACLKMCFQQSETLYLPPTHPDKQNKTTTRKSAAWDKENHVGWPFGRMTRPVLFSMLPQGKSLELQ